MPNNQTIRVSNKPLLLIAAAIMIGGAAAYFSNSLSPESNGFFPQAQAAEGIAISAPTKPITEPKGVQTAVFAGGCFWGVEGVFEHVRGVATVESGYSGGRKVDADYGRVSDGRTSHAEFGTCPL